MKNSKVIIAALLACGMALGTNAQLKIKGSDTVLPLSQKEAENYMKGHKGADVSVTGGGSGVGFTALIDNNTDIAMASRGIKTEEKLKLSEGNKAYKEVMIAKDALAVIVNPGNPVSQLTRQQLEDIFTGKVTSWKEVGGPDEKIVVYTRETSSGTYEFFKEHVMLKKNYTSTALAKPATGDIVQSVSQTKGAIGYIGLAYVNKKVKPLGVSFDGKTFEKPSFKGAKTGTYPVSRPLFYYYLVSKEKAVKPFLDYVLSKEGQKTVDEVGYVSIK
jgi:phosphate transport system substrate-binding protein